MGGGEQVSLTSVSQPWLFSLNQITQDPCVVRPNNGQLVRLKYRPIAPRTHGHLFTYPCERAGGQAVGINNKKKPQPAVVGIGRRGTLEVTATTKRRVR